MLTQATVISLVGCRTYNVDTHKVNNSTNYFSLHKQLLYTNTCFTQTIALHKHMLYTNTYFTQTHTLHKHMLYTNTCFTQTHTLHKHILYTNTCFTQTHTLHKHMLYTNTCFTQTHTLHKHILYTNTCFTPSVNYNYIQHTHYRLFTQGLNRLTVPVITLVMLVFIVDQDKVDEYETCASYSINIMSVNIYFRSGYLLEDNITLKT